MFIADPGSRFFPIPGPGAKDPGSARIRIILVRILIGNTDPDPGGPLKDEDVSCILDVLNGGLGISKLQILIKKNMNFLKFF
jgi:hypothetical protein